MNYLCLNTLWWGYAPSRRSEMEDFIDLLSLFHWLLRHSKSTQSANLEGLFCIYCSSSNVSLTTKEPKDKYKVNKHGWYENEEKVNAFSRATLKIWKVYMRITYAGMFGLNGPKSPLSTTKRVKLSIKACSSYNMWLLKWDCRLSLLCSLAISWLDSAASSGSLSHWC